MSTIKKRDLGKVKGAFSANYPLNMSSKTDIKYHGVST